MTEWWKGFTAACILIGLFKWWAICIRAEIEHDKVVREIQKRT